MDYGIDIYNYDSQYIFTGFLYIKNNSYPGTYRYPILKISSDSDIVALARAIKESTDVLTNNHDLICNDNDIYNLSEMDKILFQNFKKIGIKDSKTKIYKKAVMVSIVFHEESYIDLCTAKGRHMMINKTINIPRSIDELELSKIVKNLLQTTPDEIKQPY